MPHSISAYLLGQAQHSYHNVAATPDPLELMLEAARAALVDANIEPDQVDAIGCVDPLSWTYANLGERVGAGIGCKQDLREFWLPAGGTTPLDLLHEITEAMAQQELDVALIVGAEAMRTRRKAVRSGSELPWPERDKTVKPMRGQNPFTSSWEAQHGLRLPIQVFPLLENSIRASHQRNAGEQMELAAQLLHENAVVAQSNPNAWFADAPSAQEISTVSTDNRMICYPYTKCMNAIMDVDQAAAVVVVSDRVLQRSGQAASSQRNRAAAVLGGAGCEEVWNPSQRPHLDRCTAMEIAFSATLESAGVDASGIDAFDLYSCFPSPIQLALDALNMTTQDDRPLTITGGLAYAGGPGNNYVMHSLATALLRLRTAPQERLLVTGVGMANTKHAATVLCHADHVPKQASGKTHYRIENPETPLELLEQVNGPAQIASYTIEYDREGNPTNVIYVLTLTGGNRTVANARQPNLVAKQLIDGPQPIGRRGEVQWDADEAHQFFDLQEHQK